MVNIKINIINYKIHQKYYTLEIYLSAPQRDPKTMLINIEYKIQHSHTT